METRKANPNEKADYVSQMAQTAGWKIIAAFIEEQINYIRDGLEIIEPGNPILPNSQGRIVAFKQVLLKVEEYQRNFNKPKKK